MTFRAKASRKYAAALFESTDHLIIEARVSALESISTAFARNPELERGMLNPIIPLVQREQVLREVARLAAPDDTTLQNFVVLLLQNGRIGLVQEIAAEYRLLLEELKKTLAVEVTSASSLEHGDRQHFEHQVREQIGGLASFKWTVDPKLIAGITVRAGDKILDTSIAGGLERLRNEIV